MYCHTQPTNRAAFTAVQVALLLNIILAFMIHLSWQMIWQCVKEALQGEEKEVVVVDAFDDVIIAAA
jgi:hypothetical protein